MQVGMTNLPVGMTNLFDSARNTGFLADKNCHPDRSKAEWRDPHVFSGICKTQILRSAQADNLLLN
jgi:hypothetical protein